VEKHKHANGQAADSTQTFLYISKRLHGLTKYFQRNRTDVKRRDVQHWKKELVEIVSGRKSSKLPLRHKPTWQSIARKTQQSCLYGPLIENFKFSEQNKKLFI